LAAITPRCVRLIRSRKGPRHVVAGSANTPPVACGSDTTVGSPRSWSADYARPRFAKRYPHLPNVAACLSSVAFGLFKKALGESLLQTRTLTELASVVAHIGMTDVVLEPPSGPAGADASNYVDIGRMQAGRAVRCVVYFDPKRHAPESLLHLGRAGATSLILANADDNVEAIRRCFERSWREVLVQELCKHKIRLPADLMELAVWVLCDQLKGHRAKDAARAMGVSTRTATKVARRAGFRGMESFLSRVRVVEAIGYAQAIGGSVERIAYELGYSSASHLAGMVHRQTGTSLKNGAAGDLGDLCRALFTDVSEPLESSFQQISLDR